MRNRTRVAVRRTTEKIDLRALRSCLGQYATGVTVVTASVDGSRVGVTANSFSSLSLDPPLVLWSIGKSSRSYEAFCRAETFAVNVLAVTQLSVSRVFASSAEDKFDGVDWSLGVSGAPLITGSAGAVECAVDQVIPAGDHALIIGRVLDFVHNRAEPLLFVQGQYGMVSPHPASQDDDSADPAGSSVRGARALAPAV